MTVRILVADDSRASQPSIITQLPRSLHFDVTEAVSGQETVTLLNTAEFELLLLNLSRSPADNFRVVEATTHALCQPRIVMCYTGAYPEQPHHLSVETITFIHTPLDRRKIAAMLSELGFL